MYYNTYAPLSTDAYIAAGIAGGASPIWDSAHTSNGKILNKPHYHPYSSVSGEKLDSHSFFGL